MTTPSRSTRTRRPTSRLRSWPTIPTSTATRGPCPLPRTQRAGASTSPQARVTFTPTADLCGDGLGSFDYDISDGNGGSDSASVTVDITCVNDGPVAIDDTASGTEDMPLIIDPADLLADDTDVDLDTLSVTGVSNSVGGLAVLAAGSITFTPTANLCGAAGFDYDISDGNGGSDSGHVAIDLDCTNDGPVAIDDTASGTEDMPLIIDPADLLADDTDVDLDTLSVTGVSNSVGGLAVLAAGSITFTPTANLCGAAGFDYDISDGNGGSDSGHVAIDLDCTNDGPVAVDDTASGTEDMPLIIDPADLLADDTDVDLDTLSVTGVSNSVGGLAVLAAGSITFTPTANLCGAAGFDYDISDGNGGSDTVMWRSTSIAPTMRPSRSTTRAASQTTQGLPTSTSSSTTRTRTAIAGHWFRPRSARAPAAPASSRARSASRHSPHSAAPQ